MNHTFTRAVFLWTSKHKKCIHCYLSRNKSRWGFEQLVESTWHFCKLSNIFLSDGWINWTVKQEMTSIFQERKRETDRHRDRQRQTERRCLITIIIEKRLLFLSFFPPFPFFLFFLLIKHRYSKHHFTHEVFPISTIHPRPVAYFFTISCRPLTRVTGINKALSLNIHQQDPAPN